MYGLNIVDLIILGILITGAVKGYNKGLLVSLASLFSKLIGLFVAYRFYPVLAQWANTQLHLSEKLAGFLQDRLVLPQSLQDLHFSNPALAEAGGYLDRLALPGPLKMSLLEYMGKLGDNLVLFNVQQLLHNFLATIIINGIAFILIWFVVDKGIILVMMIVTSLSRSTAVGGLNRLAGLAVGLALSFLTLTILLGLFQPLLTVTDSVEPTLFSAVTKALGEARSIPYFQKAFAFISGQIVNLLLL